MTAGPIVHFAFDYVDPTSYLLDLRLRRWSRETGGEVVHEPWEVRPPPLPLLSPGDDPWRARWEAALAEAERTGVELHRPRLVPWSRKAHELAFLARERGCFPALHEALFRAFFVEGRDLGRVDVLVRIGVEVGLGAGEVKVVLDVDRFTGAVQTARSRLEAEGIRTVPTLRRNATRLEGFPGPDAVEAFLASEDSGAPESEGAHSERPEDP